MTRTPKNPAASARAPVVPPGAARATVPGGPATSLPPEVAGGKTSRQAVSPDSTPDGRPGPETARPGPAAVRAGDQTPAGVPTPRAGGTPAGSTALSGEEWRKEVKRATSAQHAEARRRATRYVPRSGKGVQAASGPGMVRRMPPPQTPGDDAA